MNTITTTYINIKMQGRYCKIKCTASQVEELGKVTIGSPMFLKLGDKNYNVTMIEHWSIDEIEGEDDDD